MRERAVSVDLEPRIEEPCMQDLARFCSDDATEKGNVSIARFFIFWVSR